jgi:hypothetical protein
MPSIGAKLIPVGPIGPVGATGSQGTNMPEPFTGVNGRRNANWNPVLPLSGGSGSPMSGGMRFGSQVAASGTDLSKHISFGYDGYGFSITPSTLNCVASLRHQFYSSIGYQGEIRAHEYWFTSDGYRLSFNTSTGDLIFYDPSSNAQFGWYGGRVVTWTHGYMYSAGGGSEHVIRMNGRGVQYTNIGGNGFNFNWDGTVYGRVDNAVQFAFQRVCDEKLKQDIAPSTFDCLAAIRKMRFYQFRWKDYRNPLRPKPAQEDAPTIPIGFVAQRLYEDFPEAVVRLPKLVDKGALAMWSGDVNTLLATLCGAIQQLDAEVAALPGES